ncbi:MAG: ATP-grasp domain-containing protein [Thermoleophilia bacterium]|nr:ATP-grasp domain-containing protein [Thermoleophilia bacterium]
MRPLSVLVTASGAPGTAALLRALRGNGEREIRLVGCDMAERAVGRHLCDAFQRVPPGGSPLFASALLELARRERVDAVLPQSSHDLAGLAAARADFAAEGIAVLVSSPEAVATANDKAACYELLERIGVRVPRWRRVQGGRELSRAAASLGYPAAPVCFKPVMSSGSRGFRVLDPAVDRLHQLLYERPGSLAMRLEEALELLPEVGGEELLVMEYVEGEERTIDGIALGGRLLLGHPKTREAMRAGLAMFFRTLDDAGLMEVARRVVAGLGLDHFFNVQLKGDAVIEVNPRISTIVYQEDLNLPYLGLRHALGELDAEELALLARRVRPTRRALRFFDQLEWDA